MSDAARIKSLRYTVAGMIMVVLVSVRAKWIVVEDVEAELCEPADVHRDPVPPVTLVGRGPLGRSEEQRLNSSH